MQTIYLIPRGKPTPGASWADRKPIAVELTQETDYIWIGRPVANPACPVLDWPKYAWEEVTPA